MKSNPMTDPCVEAVARIIEPRLWSSPWNYPDGIEHDDELERRRNVARSKAEAVIARLNEHTDPTPALTEAAQAILDRMTGTYKARNGRMASIEGDDGEKCWIVHSDDIENLRHALSASPTPASVLGLGVLDHIRGGGLRGLAAPHSVGD